jgi:hypothetical protein
MAVLKFKKLSLQNFPCRSSLVFSKLFADKLLGFNERLQVSYFDTMYEFRMYKHMKDIEVERIK